MPGIDESRQFIALKIAVLTVSDTRSLDDDTSGSTLAERIEKAGHAVAVRAIVTDDVETIRAQVKAWIADPAIDVVISTGGTGFTGRDVTPEALEPLFEKRMEGFATLFLMVSHAKIGTSAIQTRANAGVAFAIARAVVIAIAGLTDAHADARNVDANLGRRRGRGKRGHRRGTRKQNDPFPHGASPLGFPVGP